MPPPSMTVVIWLLAMPFRIRGPRPQRGMLEAGGRSMKDRSIIEYAVFALLLVVLVVTFWAGLGSRPLVGGFQDTTSVINQR